MRGRGPGSEGEKDASMTKLRATALLPRAPSALSSDLEVAEMDRPCSGSPTEAAVSPRHAVPNAAARRQRVDPPQ
jgi:hypothetical protein